MNDNLKLARTSLRPADLRLNSLQPPRGLGLNLEAKLDGEVSTARWGNIRVSATRIVLCDQTLQRVPAGLAKIVKTSAERVNTIGPRNLTETWIISQYDNAKK